MRRVRDSLKRMREERTLQQAEVARQLDWSTSKLIRIENGSVGISVTDLRALATYYRAPEETVEQLVELTRRAKTRPWWSGNDFINAAYKKYIGYEAETSRMRQYHLSIVPGLLQTEAYMRELIPALRLTPVTSEELNGLAEVRQRRQREIIHAAEGPEIVMLIDEAALRRRVGDAQVMLGQLERLQDAAEQPRLHLAVLPFSTGPHPGQQGGFTVMEFPDAIDGDILVQENATGNLWLDEKSELVGLYAEQFGKMLGRSLQGDRAVEFLATVAREYR